MAVRSKVKAKEGENLTQTHIKKVIELLLELSVDLGSLKVDVRHLILINRVY